MKNVQIIDDALNAVYAVYKFEDEQFAVIFPLFGQDIEFIEDVEARLSENAFDAAFANVWQRKLQKPMVFGIHGTLFYGMINRSRFYPGKKQADLIVRG